MDSAMSLGNRGQPFATQGDPFLNSNEDESNRGYGFPICRAFPDPPPHHRYYHKFGGRLAAIRSENRGGRKDPEIYGKVTASGFPARGPGTGNGRLSPGTGGRIQVPGKCRRPFPGTRCRHRGRNFRCPMDIFGQPALVNRVVQN